MSGEMLHFQSRYGFKSSWLNYCNEYHVKRSMSDGCLMVSNVAELSKEEKKSTIASQSHKEAERRRRQRIHSHLSMLHTLLPNPTKTDKASLLMEMVSHVKELTRQVTEVVHWSTYQCYDDDIRSEIELMSSPFPSEEDEATLCYCDNKNKVMRATVCCDERSSLNRDLMQAIRLVHVRAEAMTVGGGTKNVVVLEWTGGDGGGGDGSREEEFLGLRLALKAVVENQAQSLSGNKRARAACSVGNQLFTC